MTEAAPESDWLPGWAEALVVGVLSRAFAVAVLTYTWANHVPAPIGRIWNGPLLFWDAEWYLFIARAGYHAQAVAITGFGPGYHDFAFFPLYPGLIIAFSLGGTLPWDVVAPAISNVAFVLALAPIRIVMERSFGREIARFGILLFAFSPAAYVFSGAYSEPIFLLIAGLFFVTSGPVRNSILAALGMLTRLGGVALAVASVADLLDARTRWRGIASIAAVGITFAAWWLWIANLTGNLMGYMLGSPSWYLMDGPTVTPTGIVSLLGHLGQPWEIVSILFVGLYAIGVVALFVRREWRLGLFSFAALASAQLVQWSVMPRLVSIGFPAFAAFAAMLPNDKVRWAVVGLSVVGEAYLAAYAISRYIVP